MSTPQKKILVVLTSADKLPNGKPTGWYLPELAHPYYELKDDFKLVVASPAGGAAPLDQASVEAFKSDPIAIKFLDDKEAQDVVKHTVKLSSVNASDFDAIFYVGGHGPLVDLAVDQDSIKLIENFYSSGKITAAVCHAPAVFNKTTHGGKPLISGKRFTGFSNVEEEAVGMTNDVPFLLETSLTSLGGKYEKASEPWAPWVVVDGNLYTGQNPASAGPLAERIKKDLLA
ncbi:hypothetical protein QFC19_003685 [Naganishia cerealis]|uniref:Uncharacterized protein n=1 Tax=Naganishia cerealis TaxID=610337 RepID=A0ACC2W054_9TREE|nr:hypothetical protein QFC19_003685 [Naganishia cerealis]